MPLSQQLKSNMVGIPAEITQKRESDRSIIKPLNMPEFGLPVTPTDGNIDVSANTPSQKSDTVPMDPNALRSIEAQLRTLNQNVLDLSRSVSDSKNIDFRSVFAKIDSARVSIEKLITPSVSQPATEIGADIQKVLTLLQSIIEKQKKNDHQLTQTLRDNATFQIQVRQGMQRDIDTLKEQMSGEQFNPLLKEIASVYVEYQSLFDDESISDRFRNNLHSLFEQLEDMLSDYDAKVCRSEVGSVRQTKACKIIDKIPTGDQEKHNTIAASRKPGVVRGRSVLYPEFVDVFIYDPALVISEPIENKGPETAIETPDSSVEDPPTFGTTIEPADKIDSQDNLGGNE